MGLRADVIHELQSLDTSTKAMRKFGCTVGPVLVLITVWGFRKDWPPLVIWPLFALAALLILFGLASPALLRPIHRVWMTFALILGWCMSRLILTLLFVLAIVPMALLGKLLKLPFTQMRRTTPKDSYWVDPPKRTAKHHTDMF